MEDSPDRATRLALDLALTVRHDGDGGIADDLADPSGLTTWVRARPGLLPGADSYLADPAAPTAVRELRAAVRTLFAHAVRPADPSPADADRLLPLPEAGAPRPAATVREWPATLNATRGR